jgi:hypothetical protein
VKNTSTAAAVAETIIKGSATQNTVSRPSTTSRNVPPPTAAELNAAARINSDPGAAIDAALTKRIIAHALERGLLLLSCGMHGNAIRVMVPLTASEEIVDEGLAIFEEALAAAVAEGSA